MCSMKILFVCHGNICRSPMAEFVMKDMLAKAGRDDLSPAAAWYVVPTNELDTTSARFFRLSIDQQESAR